MRILVDADSMTPRVRSIIANAACRSGVDAIFVANRILPLGQADERVSMVVADDTDEWLASHADPDDLAITRDVPLAARIVERGALVLSDRGERFTKENIGRRLSERAFAMSLRVAGELGASRREETSRAAADRATARAVASFANELDRELTRRSRGTGGS